MPHSTAGCKRSGVVQLVLPPAAARSCIARHPSGGRPRPAAAPCHPLARALGVGPGGRRRCRRSAGRALRAGGAARRGSPSRAPRRCNRKPERSPPTPGHFPFTPRCLIERRGEGLRVPRRCSAQDSFTKKLGGPGRKNSLLGRSRN